jgi:hypothetical protein
VFVPLSLVRSHERDARIANHLLLVLAVADEDRFPSDLVADDMPLAAAAPPLTRRQVLDALNAEISRDGRGAHTLLISAEHIHTGWTRRNASDGWVRCSPPWRTSS